MRRTLRALCVQVRPSGLRLEGTFHLTTNQLAEGVATLADGRVFKGRFDETSGRPLTGAQLEEDGDLYRGAFNEQWQRHGVGEAFLLDGTHYKGTFAADELVEGRVQIPDPAGEIVFEGTLRNEEFHVGSLRQPSFSYTGAFEKNVPHGKGSLRWASGATQDGTFLGGKLHGDKCKMRLESGDVYVGEFNNGDIRRGELFSATFHYDGEFNSDGRAHGEGVQTQLASSPRLIFNGLWREGTLVRGTCHDEDGNPVDWLDDHDIKREMLGGNKSAGDSYTRSVTADALQRDAAGRRDGTARPAPEPASAEALTAALGIPPSLSATAQMASDASGDAFASRNDVQDRVRTAKTSTVEGLDPARAATAALQQLGCEDVMRSHLQSQLGSIGDLGGRSQ